jgi:hypothetical protein
VEQLPPRINLEGEREQQKTCEYHLSNSNGTRAKPPRSL